MARSTETSQSRKPYPFEVKVASFWAKVDRSAGPDACWIWKGAVNARHGYGSFAVAAERALGAHKVAWMLTNGCPGSLCVLHTCDNRVCVNPKHLFLGTKQDNVDDMMEKGRDPFTGEKSHWTNLTDVLVMEIIAKGTGLRGKYGAYRKLAAEYGCSPATIGLIIRGDTWKHLPRPEASS